VGSFRAPCCCIAFRTAALRFAAVGFRHTRRSALCAAPFGIAFTVAARTLWIGTTRLQKPAAAHTRAADRCRVHGTRLRSATDARACRHTDETLRAAVALWFDDNAAAVARYGPMGDWDTRDVKDMRELFQNRADFDEDIGRWNVGSVEAMFCMFSGAACFNQPLDKWDVSSVEDMSWMFAGAASFDQPLDMWDVSSVETMHCTFYKATNFNQPLDKWDVSSVKDMCYMFGGAASFNQPLDKWDVSSVEDMSYMVYGAAAFNQPLERWAVADGTDKTKMFDGAASFKQPATLTRFGLVLPSPSLSRKDTCAHAAVLRYTRARTAVLRYTRTCRFVAHAVRPHRQPRTRATAPPRAHL
jgi:surface protein